MWQYFYVYLYIHTYETETQHIDTDIHIDVDNFYLDTQTHNMYYLSIDKVNRRHTCQDNFLSHLVDT